METMSAGLRKYLLRDRIPIEFAFRDRLVDSGEVLINDSTGAEIQMAHFGISHLSARQSDIKSARTEFSAGIIAVELVMKRRPGEQGRVAVLFPFFTPTWIDAPAVA